MEKVLVYIRFALYGALLFAAFGYLMDLPYQDQYGVSYKLISYLALAGGGSFLVSSISCKILYEFIRDLIHGNN
jgi:hypothetical protein